MLGVGEGWEQTPHGAPPGNGERSIALNTALVCSKLHTQSSTESLALWLASPCPSSFSHSLTGPLLLSCWLPLNPVFPVTEAMGTWLVGATSQACSAPPGSLPPTEHLGLEWRTAYP